jgi:LAGLIDADG endonuclease
MLPILAINNSKDLNLEETKKDLSLKKKIFKSDYSDLNYKEFQMFINGLYQAEGIMGVYFPRKDSLRVVFYFSIGQNYSSEAALLFLRLQATFGFGNLKIELSNTGKPHIKYVVTNTKDILFKVIPYFTFIYGQKRIDLNKLSRIYNLSTVISLSRKKTFNEELVSELIHLVYSTNPDGQKRKITLTEKLSIFNCSTPYQPKFDLLPDNIHLPSKFFILGLFIGDGNLGFVFDEPKTRAPKFYIKLICNFASQKANFNNIYLFSLISKSMGLKPRTYKLFGSMITLSYSNEIVYKKILPFLSEHREWLY